jgi:hypothetical protein
MNKKLFLIAIVCISAINSKAQSSKIDTVAISILDKMSATIGDMASCSVTVNANYDVHNQDLGLVKHSNESHVYLQGPDKLLISSEGDKGSRSFYYDGKTLSYYSIDKNRFSQIETLPTTVGMIDTVNKMYGIEFPAADFLYPSFVDDILADAKNLVYLGITKVNGKECFHIAGTTDDKTFQFWISNDVFYLPAKVVIVYTKKELNPQYEAVLSDWKINPVLPDALFEFKAPPGAKKIKLLPIPSHK